MRASLSTPNRFAFNTPIFVFDASPFAGRNDEIKAHLMAEKEQSPGIVQSNAGGWHSKPVLSSRPLFRGMISLMIEQVNWVVEQRARELNRECPRFRYNVQSWGMVLGPSDYVVPHNHGDAHWSAVYYVDDGAPGPAPHSGALEFVDTGRPPRPVPGLDLFPSTFMIQPITSMLVVFPGWLTHYVHPHRGLRPRISLSFNFVMEPLT